DADTDADTDTGFPCLDDPFEDNDGFATAQPLPANAGDLVVRNVDEDFWSIVVPENTRMTIDVLHSVALGDIDVELYLDGVEVDAGATGSDDETVELANFSDVPVVAVMRVFLWAPVPPSSDPCNTYDVVLTPTPLPVCGDDPFEPNDSQDLAAFVFPGVLSGIANPMDPDFFAFEVPEGGAVLADLDLSTTPGTSLTLYDPSGNVVDVDFFAAYDVETSNAAEGVWTIGVEVGDCVFYDLDLQVIGPPSCFDDAFEPNDVRAGAPLLAEGTVSGISTGPTDPDFFRIRVPPGRLVTVEVTAATPFQQVDAQLTNNNGTVLLDAASGATLALSWLNESAQTRTVSLVLDALSCAESTVTVGFVDVDCSQPDAAEPNGVFGNATLLGPLGSMGGLNVSPSDRDLYRLDVPENHRVTAIVTVPDSLPFTPTVSLYDGPDGNIVDSDSFGPAYDVADVNATGSDQTYFVEVGGPDGCTTYDMSWSVQSCSLDDALEPNDSPSQLVTVVAGDDLVVNDQSDDYFFVGVVQPFQTVTAHLTFTHALGDIDADLEDPNGVDLPGTTGGASVSNEENVVWTNNSAVPQPVVLHVFLFGFQGCRVNSYDFDVTFSPGPTP
ncbi:MAG: hypothetical protein KC621_12750, partial [Myxococcales bacterium]|nr:hypothetical protein [Myxococcales bacterium]